MGIFFWLLCILAVNQLKLCADNIKPLILHNTLIAFFIINAVFSFANIFAIIIETHAFNPYLYQGLFQKYFIGTGDYIKGVFFDTSTTNAIINAFGVIYFLNKNKIALTLMCMSVLLLTASNSTNMLLAIVLIGIFFFQSTRNQKSVIAICLCMLILFLAKVSPQNNQYALKTVQKIFNKEEDEKKLNAVMQADTSLHAIQMKTANAALDSIKNKIAKENQHASLIQGIPDIWKRPALPEADINAHEYQSNTDTTQKQKELLNFSVKEKDDSSILTIKNNPQNLPGKLIALKQTLYFFKENPFKTISGTGMGNFSSKLAFRATALKIAGSYPLKYHYINKDFKENHLALYLYFFIKQAELHSVINTPDNTYDQLLSEYGVIGLLSFLFFYIAFFLKRIEKPAYSIPLLIIMSGSFFLGYWFEQLSVVVLFELLMFAEMKNITPVINLEKENR